MKITLAVATTQDGFINRIGQKHASDWTSDEDKKQYTKLLRRYKLQIMGLTTYLAYADKLKTNSIYYRIILTHNPENYQSVAGKLLFTNEPIHLLVKRLEYEGFKHANLLGGGKIFSQFLDEGLVDDAFVTVEPLFFGKGIPFLAGKRKLVDYLRLVETQILNEKGTKLLHYVRK